MLFRNLVAIPRPQSFKLLLLDGLDLGALAPDRLVHRRLDRGTRELGRYEQTRRWGPACEFSVPSFGASLTDRVGSDVD